jgi:hypothetical protein
MRYDLSATGERKTSNLELHPLNKHIYGDCVADSALVDSVKKNGIFNPIIVNQDGVILSGTRRWAAAKLAGLDKVPTIRFIGKDSLTEELFLIESNRQRIKTESQKDAEVAALLRIETELAKHRQQAGVRLNPAEGGKAVEKVAAVTGESADTVRKRAEIHAANVDPVERNQQSTHLAYQNLPKPTSCDICGQQFESKGAMNKHRRKAHADEMAKRMPVCESGKRQFDSVEELYAFRVGKGKTQPVAYFNCRKCGKVHADKNQVQSFDAHARYYHPDAPKPENAPPEVPVWKPQAAPSAHDVVLNILNVIDDNIRDMSPTDKDKVYESLKTHIEERLSTKVAT